MNEVLLLRLEMWVRIMKKMMLLVVVCLVVGVLHIEDLVVVVVRFLPNIILCASLWRAGSP